MIHQPPAGARDLLPLEVAQKAWINDRLQSTFQRWGYQRIVTSTLEWLDTLVAGGAINPETVVHLQGTSEGHLGLRPELTASIARAAVTRLTETDYPQRLCYRANVFRKPPTGYPGRQMEFFQAGVELLFVGGIRADAEILLLLAHSLKGLEVGPWHLILGDAGLTKALLESFPQPLQRQVQHCITHLDFVQLQSLDYPSADLKLLAVQLFDLRGTPAQVFEQLSQLNLKQAHLERVHRLKSLVHLIQSSYTAEFPLVVDLSWLQPFDYYTGIVFQVVSSAAEQWHILGQGGRYDQLLSQYHPQHLELPGIGFSFNVEALHTCLLTKDHLPKNAPLTDWLVIPSGAEAEIAAFGYAQRLRLENPQLRVELDLGEKTDAEIKAYARYAQIRQLAWIEADGTARVENPGD